MEEEDEEEEEEEDEAEAEASQDFFRPQLLLEEDEDTEEDIEEEGDPFTKQVDGDQEVDPRRVGKTRTCLKGLFSGRFWTT